MSTKTIGAVGRGSGWQKVGIELGSYVCNPNSSQLGMFQTFAILSRLKITKVTILAVSKPHLLVVSVPVLSEQMVVALPIVSQASRCLTRLLSDIIFWREIINMEEIFVRAYFCSSY